MHAAALLDDDVDFADNMKNKPGIPTVKREKEAYKSLTRHVVIGLYRENAIAIEGEARDPFGGNVYYVTMQITFHIPEFARKERNLHCDVVGAYTLPPNGSLDSFWITRSQRSRRVDKGLYLYGYDNPRGRPLLAT